MMQGPSPTIGQFAAAILLPPLAIYLVRGLGPAFWVGVVLTLFWWVPGVVFALATLFMPHHALQTGE